IENADRAVGARLGGALAMELGTAAPPGSARMTFTGQAGQSFGAFLTDGIEFLLIGEANDYVGKGMGGGRIIVRPPDDDAGDPHLLGNTVLYGATGGEVFVYDAGIRLPAMVNAELVDVHRLSGEHQLLLEQGLRLRELLERHAAYTGSSVAQAILQDWHDALHRFWRIAPKADVARIENQHEGTLAARA